MRAFDENINKEEITINLKPKQEYQPVIDAIPQEYFPPCIQHISQGLTDGKKRALFILINFLSSCGWNFDQIEQYLKEWNKKNPEPLREVYIQGQIRHHKQQKKKALPPNCDNKAYMIDLGACKPDGFCKKIRNPANYTISKQRMIARMNEKDTQKKKKDNNTKQKPEENTNDNKTDKPSQT